ncbi:hypothetical protein ACSSS7_003307 [Eimeria intestinalis]
MPHSGGVAAHTASLELTPVGGRISIVAAFAPTVRNPTTTTDLAGLSEELDKLAFGEAHAARGPPQGGLLEGLAFKRVSERRENETRNKCQGGPKTESVCSGGDHCLFRVHQQQIVGGQQALRLSVWRASNNTGPSTALSKAQGGPDDAAAITADARGLSTGSQNGSNPPQHSACNFYFRLPCELPSLRLLGASLNTGRKPSAIEANEAMRNERQYEIRLSLHCAIRPGSLSEALQDREDRSELRSVRGAIPRGHRLSSSFCTLDGGARCRDRLYLSPSDTKNVLTGPWGSYSEGKCRRRAAITCASCGNLLGSGKEWRGTSATVQSPAKAADSARELSADKETASSDTPGCCVDKRESASVDEGKNAEEQLPASQASSEQIVGPSLGLRTEVSLLKRRINLHSYSSGTWGVCNLLERHSDLAAFTEELCTYSRAASALRFLVLPFEPPRGAECPWEVGRQAAPLNISKFASSNIPEQKSEGNLRASAEAWVFLPNGSAAALDLRILLRECFVALSGTRDAGSQGRMAMKVLLREVWEGRTTALAEKPGNSSNRGSNRTHLARVGLRLFSELLRLQRDALRRIPEKSAFDLQEETRSSVGSEWGEDAVVVFLPML